MARGFETGSDNEKIGELQRQLDDVLDSQINGVGGNENISIDSARGARNDASGDAGGVRSNEPIIHQITDVDEGGTPTGVFDKINIISSMAIIDHTSTPITLRFIQGPAKDGARIKITPKIGKTIEVESGGNILTSSTITITDTDYYELVKYSEAETGVTGGAYKILLIGTGGGGEFFGPWTANHDAGNFALNNVSSIQISDSIGGVHSLLQGLAGTGTRLTLTAGEKFEIFDNITQLLEISANEVNVFGNSINNILSLDIEDSAGDTKLGISGPLGVGARFSFVSGDSVFFTENITNRLEINASGISLLGGDITMGSGDITMGSGGNIIGGGAGEGMTNIGHLDFIDNLATPVAAVSLYSDGTDMLVNTGGGVVNLSDVGGGIFLDNTFRVIGSGDQSKELAFEVDTFTTATTRTFGWPDADGTVFITPAQDDLDLNTFDIFDIDKLAFMNFASTGSSLNIGFSALGSGGFRANVLNNGDFEITEENILHFNFDGGLNSINVIDSLFNVLETVGSTSYQIAKFNGETILTEPTKIQQQIAGSDIFDIQSGGITMADSKFITNVDQIGFRILGNFIEDDASGMRYISVPGDQHLFGDGTNIFATLDVEGLFLNQLFIQFTSIASPGPTGSSNVGELFMDSGNSDHLSIIRDSSVIDLEASGEINTASNVGGFAEVFKQKVGVDLEFRTLVGGTDIQIVQVADTLTFNFNGTPAAPVLDGVQEFEIPTTDLNIDGDLQEIFITNGKQGYEVANASSFAEDVANYFPVYVGQRGRVTDLGWNNLELSAGTITFTMALYENIGGGVNYPGDRIVVDTSATVTGQAQAARTDSLTPTNIEAGLYWIGIILTNLQIGSVASCSRHDTAGANSAGYFDDEGNTDVFLSILGFAGAETSLPSTADSEMAALTENPPAVFMRLIPNTS